MSAARVLVLLSVVACGCTAFLVPLLPESSKNFTDVEDLEVNATNCYTLEEAEAWCRDRDIIGHKRSIPGESDDVSVKAGSRLDFRSDDEQEDVTQLLDSWDASSQDKMDWRKGSMRERNRYLLKEQMLTDCTFIVGPENDTQTIRAHKLLLQRASSLFEAIFNTTRGHPIRVPDVTPSVFTALLEFIYAGDTCIENFDSACELARVAAKFQVPALVQRCRAFLWSELFPGNVWRAYQCATAANDTELRDLALQVAQIRTEEAFMDPRFNDLSHEALVSFLSQDSLNVKSELHLLDASLRWAMAEAARRGLSPSPESLRTVLGTALRLIRFLTLTPKQFSESQLTSQVLTCGERLAILYNLNVPGVLPMPDTLSSNKNSRSLPTNQAYLDVVVPVASSSCENDTTKLYVKNSAIPKNTFDLFSTNIKSISLTRSIRGIHVPSQIKPSNVSTSSYLENITLYVMNTQNKVQTVAQFQGSIQYNSLIYVRLQDSVVLSSCSGQASCQQVRVRFGVPGRYPVTYMGPSKVTTGIVKTNEYVRELGAYTYVFYLGDQDYVYSIVL